MSNADDVLRTGVSHLVHQVLRAEYGTDAVIQRPLSPRFSSTMPAPADYRAGIEAARLVREHATRLVLDYARKARGEGVPWRDLAGPLGVITDGPWDPPAERAFELVAGEPLMPHDTRWVSWTCTSCGQSVTDRGPYGGHPTDTETGHGDTCTRHQDEITTYMARLND